MQIHVFKYFIAVGIVWMAMMPGCTAPQKHMAGNYTPPSHSPIPNYSNLYYWAAHPYKHDPSDSTPEAYRNFLPDSTVDVFFIHPTTYTSDTAIDENLLGEPGENKRWNANVNDAALNIKTDYSTILSQASAFNHYRLFAPRYRQAHIRSFYIDSNLAKPFFDTAYADIKAAFRYYLEHYNQGRPFIIASHSQGTVHAGRLVRDTIENMPLGKKMVAAYLIGMPVREDYFANCEPCATASQTGCFVSWRTFKQNYMPPLVAQEPYKVYVTNPHLDHG